MGKYYKPSMGDEELDSLCEKMWARGIRPSRTTVINCGGHGSSDRIKGAITRWRNRHRIGEITIREEPDPSQEFIDKIEARKAAMAPAKQREAEIAWELERLRKPYTIPYIRSRIK